VEYNINLRYIIDLRVVLEISKTIAEKNQRDRQLHRLEAPGVEASRSERFGITAPGAQQPQAENAPSDMTVENPASGKEAGHGFRATGKWINTTR